MYGVTICTHSQQDVWYVIYVHMHMTKQARSDRVCTMWVRYSELVSSFEF